VTAKEQLELLEKVVEGNGTKEDVELIREIVSEA